MKKIIFGLLLTTSLFAFGQSGSDNVSMSGDKFYVIGGRRTPSHDKIIDGDPYINGKSYLPVVIEGYSKNVQPLRYNAYEDEMEFAQDNVNYYADKMEGKVINFPGIKKKYVAMRYMYADKPYFGYLQVLTEGNTYILYKREKVELMAGEKSPSAYTKDANDYYAKAKDVYLLKQGNQFIKFPKGNKEALAIFSNVSGVEKFVKDNKLNLSKEEDMIKLVNFANQ